MKECSSCKKSKAIADFSPSNQKRNGAWCKDCYNQNNRKRWIEAKQKIFDMYGESCACCGETNKKFLSIDHTNGGGNKHRKIVSNVTLTHFLSKNEKLPDYQILCYNCNMARGFTGSCHP